jgi:SOS-response transcriptional repressor LexA
MPIFIDELTIRRERSRPGSTHTMRRYDERTKPEKVFDTIVAYTREHDGCSPTIREIMNSCKVTTSTSVMRYYLSQLAGMGLIRRPEPEIGKRSAANIEVVGGEWSFPAGVIHE